MISLEKVEESILELEQKDTTFATCERLAWLYTVRDHLKGYEAKPENKIDYRGSSEFLQVIDGRNPERVLPIIDELVGAIETLHPRMYQAFIEKIKDEV